LFYEIEKYIKQKGRETFDQNAMNSLLKKALRVNFSGWQNKENFFLFQWLKNLAVNPDLFVTHAFYVDVSGFVILHTALSGLIPFDSLSTGGSLARNPGRIIKTAETAGANRVYIVINHPHGYMAPVKQAESLSRSAGKHLGELFGAVIISGPFFYTAFYSDGSNHSSLFSGGDPVADRIQSDFRNIMDTQSPLSIQLGINRDQRIVFWAFNKMSYPNHIYSRIIEKLGGIEEHVFLSDPDRILKIGGNASVLAFDNPAPDYSYLTEMLDKELVQVVFHSIFETEGRKTIEYFFLTGVGILEAPLTNPEILNGRLLVGSEISLIRRRNRDTALHLTEDDLIPSDMIPYLRHFRKSGFIAPFGIMTEPEKNRGMYCSVCNLNSGYLTVYFGEYLIENDRAYCLKAAGEWKIRYGILEFYILYQDWPTFPDMRWETESFQLSDTITFLTDEKLNRNFRDYIKDRFYYQYFFSDDWSVRFYRKLAELGFIAITGSRGGAVRLLPELQNQYALLDWKDLVIDSSVRKIIRNGKGAPVILRIEQNPESVLKNLHEVWQDRTWLTDQYCELIRKLATAEERRNDRRFAIWGVSLLAGPEQIPVAGELGYSIGKTFTSLSGFFRRDLKQFNNFGKLQMIMLAEVLKEKGMAFWNLGHPHMPYKTNLGARIISRNDFLKRWDVAVDCETPDLSGNRDIYAVGFESVD
ncbi:MAG: hypothetical protein JXR86_21160, partial [Spirochaetales bacterium]|nr:hypothetical protein [Spirochaetales bacterium]